MSPFASDADRDRETSAEQLIWLVRRFRQAMTESLAQRAAEPVPAAAKWLLLAVDRRPGTIGELADRLGVTKQAVSRMADTLVDLGCCERGVNDGDRREVIIGATAEGARIAATLHETLARVEAELLAPLSPPQRTAFVEMLAEIVGG